MHQFDWEAWKAKQSKESLRCPFSGEATGDADREARIRWLLGRPPKQIEGDGKHTFLTPEESAVMSHDRWGGSKHGADAGEFR